MELAIDDLRDTFKDRYPAGREYRRRLGELKSAHDALLHRMAAGSESDAAIERMIAKFRRLSSEALLANPLLDFDRLLVIKRGANKLGLPMNFEGNSSLRPDGYDNEIAVLSPLRGGRLTTLYRPAGGRFVGDVDLHFDADRLLFSMPKENGAWRLWELSTGPTTTCGAGVSPAHAAGTAAPQERGVNVGQALRSDGSGLRELPCAPDADVDNYDACYLPDGGIISRRRPPWWRALCPRFGPRGQPVPARYRRPHPATHGRAGSRLVS